MAKVSKKRTKESPTAVVYDHADDKEMFIRISKLEHELAMRKARTDRLMADVFDIGTFASHVVSPASHSYDYNQPHGGTAIEGSATIQLPTTSTSDGEDEIKKLPTKNANLMAHMTQLEAQKTEEEVLRIRIIEMEHELTMRKARTDRLRAMVDDIVTCRKQYHASSQAASTFHDDDDYYEPTSHGEDHVKGLVIPSSSVSPGKSSHRSSSSSDSDLESLIDLLCSPSPSKKHKGS